MGVDAPVGTVIVIEDDPHIADLVNLYLRREGFRVLLASEGDRGLELIKQEAPSIVILDVGLPGRHDGFDVCREIRAQGTTPVLFLTAATMRSIGFWASSSAGTIISSNRSRRENWSLECGPYFAAPTMSP